MAASAIPARPVALKPAEALKKFGKLRLRPSLAVSAVPAGGGFVAVQVSWSTWLAPDTLRVVIRRGDPVDADVTALLQVSEERMTATGTVDAGGVGALLVAASGEFLASLAPMRSMQLEASAGAYLPF